MQKNKWSRKFDWIKNGVTYYQQDRSEKYSDNRFISVGDIYFKLNKYLTGVTFTYINSLSDIYKRDLLTGDGYSIVNMYNEYDVIDRFLKNIVFVDTSSNSNVDLNLQWTKIDGVTLKPGHLVLLFNQDSEFQNDIYEVTNQYFLRNANLLLTRELSDKFSCSVKMGSNADKQYFLTNNGLEFPVTFEPKYFIEGKSFILKNLIKYNLYNSASNSAITSRIIFTDYDFARKQLDKNYSLYNSTNITIDQNVLPTVNFFIEIDYHKEKYIIRSLTPGKTLSDSANSILITNNYSGITSVPITDLDVNIGDFINLQINNTGSTLLLTLNTFVKDIITISGKSYLFMEENIPNRILKDLENNIYTLNNLNVSDTWKDAINKFTNYTPYNDFYNIISGVTNSYTSLSIVTKECKHNLYFDYDGISFKFVDNVQNIILKWFNTSNQYIKYKLLERLNEINPLIFTSSFTGITNDYLLTGFNYSYNDNNKIRILSSVSGLTQIFKPYTYLTVNGSEKTIIYDVNEYEILIERPLQWSLSDLEPALISIQNIDGLGNISDILYEIYMNNQLTTGWYAQRTDNERKYVAKTYAELLTKNTLFRKNVTGILYENENNEFLLKLYDIENDKNLYFSTIELVFIGADRKSRLPVPLKMLESAKKATEGPSYELDWNVLIDGLEDDPLYGADVFDSGLDVVLPGPNNPALIYTVIDGNAM